MDTRISFSGLPKVRRTVLWLIYPDSVLDGHSLRIHNFGKRLRAAGIQVQLLGQEVPTCKEVLARYVAEGCADGFSILPPYVADGWSDTLSRWAMHPGLKDFLRRKRYSAVIDEILSVVRRHDRPVVIVSDRNLLFVVPELGKHVPVVIDWGDSFTLATFRCLLAAVRGKAYGRTLPLLRDLLRSFLQEAHYPRYAKANVSVSPVDRAMLRRLSSTGISIVPIGIDRVTAPRMDSKTAGRLIFTGVMSFEPNYRSILWFIDRVLPLVRASRPDAHLVVAGRDPVPELLARRCDHIAVTGGVPDLSTEIAASQIYVAPMQLGSGFKNKVIEALAAGAPVIGTRMASEFLPEDLKREIVSVDEPEEMARAIVAALNAPASLTARVVRAQAILKERYSWAQCAGELMSVLDQAAPEGPAESAAAAFPS